MFECIRECVHRSRSTRRFQEGRTVSRDELCELIDVARFCPSARNRQPLRYIVSSGPDETKDVHGCLSWALDLPGWGGPIEGERPAAYITIVAERDCLPDPSYDAGIAAQTLMLAAASQGLGGCILGSIDRERLARVLSLPQKYGILLVIALGYPAETIIIESIPDGGDTRYWRDDRGVHHVPKRALSDIVLAAMGGLS